MPTRTPWTPTAAVGEVMHAADARSIPGGWSGYAEVSANQSGISTDTALTGLSVTVDVAASRRLLVLGFGIVSATAANTIAVGWVKQDGTKVGRFGQFNPSAATEFGWFFGGPVLTPAAGSRTFSLSLERVGGTGTLTLNASSDGKAYILVQDLGPAS